MYVWAVFFIYYNSGLYWSVASCWAVISWCYSLEMVIIASKHADRNLITKPDERRMFVMFFLFFSWKIFKRFLRIRNWNTEALKVNLRCDDQEVDLFYFSSAFIWPKSVRGNDSFYSKTRKSVSHCFRTAPLWAGTVKASSIITKTVIKSRK